MGQPAGQPSAQEVTVITSAVADEGKKWHELSDQVEPIKQAANELTLGVEAFFVIGDVSFGFHSIAYNDFHTFMVTALTGAVTEFDQLGGALEKMAKTYDETDTIASLNLDEIYKAS